MVVAMLGEKDIRLKQHAERVANLCANFCENTGILSGDDLLRIYLAGLLHDTGYISIPREVLEKDQPLSEKELLLVKKHPVVGVQILAHHQRLEALLPVVRHHHEAFDGSGYPDKKQGEEIPLGARLIREKRAAIALAALVAIAFSFSTWERCKVWGNDVALWSDCARKSPIKPRPHNNLGSALSNRERFEEAALGAEHVRVREFLGNPVFSDVKDLSPEQLPQEIEVVTALLRGGADPNARNRAGLTPLMRAARGAWSPSLIERLVEFGADPKLKDSEGKTAIDYAVMPEVRSALQMK